MKRAIGVSVLVALLLAGCGDDDGDGPSAATPTTPSEATGGDPTSTTPGPDPAPDGEATGPDPCDLLTPDELEVAFGSPFEAGEPEDGSNPLGQRTCTWVNTDAPPVKTFTVSVVTTEGIDEGLRDGGMTAARLYDETRAAYGDAEDVSGLGERAFRAGTSIHVVVGDVYLMTSTFLGDSAEAIAGLQTMTEAAAARL